MKLSPMQQYLIVFYTVTFFMLPIIVVLILLLIFPIRSVQNFGDELIDKLTNWRYNLKIITHYRNKAYLFDFLKDPGDV